MKLPLLQSLALLLFGAFWLGVLAGAMRFTANPDVWSGEVIAYGVGTAGFLIGIFTFVILFEGKIGEITINLSKGDTPAPADDRPGQDV